MRWGTEMTDNTHLADDLAAYTDALLTGEAAPHPPIDPDLADVVRTLHQWIGPAVQPALPFRQRLRQQLAVQWEMEHTAALSRPARRRWRMLALVAAVATLVLLVALGTSAHTGTGEDLRGTALGAGVWVAILILGAVAGGAWLWRERRR